jgi:hypothetical protein
MESNFTKVLKAAVVGWGSDIQQKKLIASLRERVELTGLQLKETCSVTFDAPTHRPLTVTRWSERYLDY